MRLLVRHRLHGAGHEASGCVPRVHDVERFGVIGGNRVPRSVLRPCYHGDHGIGRAISRMSCPRRPLQPSSDRARTDQGSDYAQPSRRDRVSGAVILLYHRVGNDTVDAHDLQVSVDHFRSHLRHLTSNYHPVTVGAVVESVATGVPLPPRSIAVSLDDGYLQNLEVVLPLLREFDVPTTFFVTTEGLDEPHENWWDVLSHVMLGPHRLPSTLDLSGDGSDVVSTATPLERRQAHDRLTQHFYGLSVAPRCGLLATVAKWSGLTMWPRDSHRVLLAGELALLSRDPRASVGAHSVHHPSLPTRSTQEQWLEVTESKSILESLLRVPVTGFSYPYGAHDPTTVDAVERGGYQYALTVEPGVVDAHADRFRLPRCEVKAHIAPTFDTWLASMAGSGW